MLTIVAAALAVAAAEPADLVVENARIYTVNPKQPVARALAVKAGRIVAVGDSVSPYIGAGTKKIDARGLTLLPGLIDAHGHMRGLGALLDSVDLRNFKLAAVVEYVQAQAGQKPAGEWITGRAWDQTNWGGAFPSAADLDVVSPDHPVYLTRVDGHAGWVNSKALALAGITSSTPDPPGGRIMRDAQGRATGILVDRAQGLVGSKIPPATDAQVRPQLKRAAEECARLGLTGVHDAGIGRQDLNAYRSLLAAGELPLRIYAMIGGAGSLWDEYLKRGPEIGDSLTVRAIKLVADGAVGSRGAALWQSYTDDKGNSGLLILDEPFIEKVARQAVEHGFQVCTHAIGDKANRAVLDAYAAALGGKNDRRFRIEHAQVVSLPDFKLFQANSVVASIQATHATSDLRWAEQRLGPDRVQGAYAWQRFLKLGIPVANGSDFPVESPNPMLGFYASITRQDVNGNPPGGWFPDQKMSRQEALYSWTLGAAYAAFEENMKGSLEPGKLADFVVIDTDIMQAPPAEILAAKVTLTVLGGKVVHGRP